jgi:PAS domain S-box-containing protein
MPEFDAIVAEAARVTAAPVAFVGFVGSDGENVQAARGWNVALIPPACGFASIISNERDLVVVGDTQRDPRFAAHPLVTGNPNIRFYAGVPIHQDGVFIGALSVLDRAPRALAADQAASLRLLGRQVGRELEVRREIQELNDRFREFFEQTDDFVMSISGDGRLLHSNEAVVHGLGYEREELTTQPLSRFLDPDVREEFRTVLAEVMESAEPRMLETVFVTSAARKIVVEGSLRPRVIDGKAVMARVIFRDITERKEFETELANARDSALDAARVKTQFLTNVSHEIRTPMNGIVGMIDLLLATQLAQEQRDYAVQAKSSADHLLSIVNNILYVSNVEAGGLAAANVDFDMYRTLDRIVEVMRIAALGKDVEVQYVFDEKLPPIFRGNQTKLRQVITNLLDNALKFTDEGKVVLSVSQQTETDSHHVIRFEVRDTGIGIAQEDRLLLFEKFSQLEGGSTRKYQGAGLGLATARHLVESMGGLIDVDSTPGKGSTFWFSIPFPKPAQGRKPIASSELDFKGKRVLLVDQFATSRKIVRHYLEGTWEMRVETGESAPGALDAMRRAAAVNDPIKVVIFDAMTDMEALSFAREVRADSRLAAASLVYLVQPSKDVNREQLREAGVNAYVARPVGQGELFDALTVALAHDALPLARTVSQPFDSRPAPPAVTPDMRKSVRVLLCEDNFLNMKLTMNQLQKLGYGADSVPNGKEAVEAVAKQDYSIVLMDCQMPVLDGYQATIEIRRLEKERGGKRRRIIAMTANALEGDREKCLAAGMDDYLAKPTKGDELESALARYFAG